MSQQRIPRTLAHYLVFSLTRSDDLTFAAAAAKGSHAWGRPERPAQSPISFGASAINICTSNGQTASNSKAASPSSQQASSRPHLPTRIGRNSPILTDYSSPFPGSE
ncbi:hypothetical protein BCR44DRAFT_1429061 [Catenaria anguillulae PL171]|uniref:Uncharacterized protein n=1 Tax=Catenaria anguillulae PL171 TaxID=765915 RepID=A0A1Y2HWJ7_9FUNG|nr:hypothetical protein BCR44DRAFT_1429061 [Catenaria anguillulae PL171]